MLPFVVVFCCTLLAISTAAPDLATRKKRQNWQTCVVNGVTYQDGEYFTLRNNPCFHYRCNKGGYQVEIWQCRDSDGTCHALNSEIRIGCTVHRCEHRENWAGFVALRYECRDSSGQCRPLNTEIRTGCSVQRCERRGNMIGFYPTEQQCRDESGQCHPVGFRRTKDCQLQECRLEGGYITIFRNVNNGPKKCKDANGVCHAPHTGTFPYRFEDGRYYNTCFCRNMGSHLSVQCVANNYAGKNAIV